MRAVAYPILAATAWALIIACDGSEEDGPEPVGKKAVEAFLASDEAAYARLVRPDYGSPVVFNDPAVPFTDFPMQVRGCSLEDAMVVAEYPDQPSTNVTILFATPCGFDPDGGRLDLCQFFTVKVGDRWYLSGPPIWPHASCR